MKDTIDTGGRCLQVQRGGSDAVADGVEDATADACRADAMAAIVLGETGEDGSITWDRDQVAVTVNVVMDLDTLRGEADQIAVVDGQPVPGEIGREIAQFATWWRRLVNRPRRRAPPRLRHEDLPARTAPPVRPRPRRRLPQPWLHHPSGVADADGPRRGVPHRGERHRELRKPLHDLPPAQDRRLRRHHQLRC
jgi:hypothetical protein